MRSIFSINGTGILTLKDLQREFSPWDIYEVLADFVAFVRVHSQPLPMKISHKEAEDIIWEDVVYINKDFWMDVLGIQDWPQESNPEKLMQMLIEEVALVSCGAKDSFGIDKNIGIDTQKKKEKCINYRQQKNAIFSEYQALKIASKLNYIIKSAKICDSVENSRYVIILLAICELSEINALDCNFSKHEMAKKEPSSQSINKNDSISSENRANTNKSGDDDNISDFPSVNDLTLLARDVPYKYWYHTSNRLETGETIKTVCVRAKASSNRYASVSIQVYDFESKRCISTISLLPNEYRYCNVAGGKIIKFLPTIAMSPDAFLCRQDLTKSSITICAEGDSEWTLDENNITSFGIANNNDGFVLVQNGKLNTVFYKKANDYITKMKMSLIVDPVVEIQLTESGYKVLTSKGVIVSDIPSYQSEGNVISVDDYSRLPIPETNVAQSNEVAEISVGSNNDCIMVRSKTPKKNMVFYRSQKKKIHIRKNNSNNINLFIE